MAKNTEILGVAAVLFILSNTFDNGPVGYAGNGPEGAGPGNRGGRPFGGLLRTLEFGSLFNDFHRMTDIMNRVDNLGQMALHPPEPKKLPSPNELFNKAMPDLSNMMENMAPLLAALGSGQNNR